MADTQKTFTLVTGASRGIGAALAEELAAGKHNLLLVARQKAELDALGKALAEKHGVTCVSLPVDLGTPNAAQTLWAQVKQGGYAVDGLVNNAGFGLRGAFAETELARELEMIQVNIVTLTALSKLALEGMVARKAGRILNIASTAGFLPGPFMAVYYASKAYVISFSEALHSELEGTGVTVTALCPGATRTAFSEVAGTEGSKLFKGSNVMDAQAVARIGYRAMQKGKSLVIAGFQNNLMIQTLRVSPRSVATSIAKGLQAPT
jgi:uncharacterized protein